ncbi:MAG: T9SS type A sorting domain-containing protein [Prevotella sp.]|nr:T9SS type A sorting domain-containing protein [Prevotella sp.]
MMRTTRTNLARVAAVLLLAVLCSTGARAEDKAKGIVVWLNDGNKTEVLFSDMPEFTYSDGNVTLKSTTTELSWPIANLQRFTFEDVIVTGIKDIKGLDILADDCDAYDPSGRLVKRNVKSLSELPAGTYIVKTGSVTVKVIRK